MLYLPHYRKLYKSDIPKDTDNIAAFKTAILGSTDAAAHDGD
jgi:hypothetical protein